MNRETERFIWKPSDVVVLSRTRDYNEMHRPGGDPHGGEFAPKEGGAGGGESAPQSETGRLLAGHLSDDEQKAITYYQDDEGFSKINESLRKGNPPGDRAHRLESAIDKFALTQDTTVYRGIGNTLSKQIADKWRDREPGDPPITFTDKAFVSTSTSKKVAEGFSKNVAELKLPKGQRALQIADRKYAGEHEVLLNRGQKYKVNSVKKTASGYRRIVLELAA